MKPKALKCPFRWEERKVMIEDRIWYIPDYYDHYENFQFPGWDHPLFFGNNHPVAVEYCSGNGGWIVEKAKAFPEWNWVAVEKKFARVRKIWSKLKNDQLTNLLVISGEAYTATQHFFPEGSISKMYINFPDPWPKKKHAKHRLIKQTFIEEISRVLSSEGKITVVTDDICYSQAIIQEFKNHPKFASHFSDPFYVTNLPHYGDSYFNTLWTSLGRAIRFHQYQKIGNRHG